MKPVLLPDSPGALLILYQIESRLQAADIAAEEEGISLTDSQVRSIIHRLGKAACGAAPLVQSETPREKILAKLYSSISAVPDGNFRVGGLDSATLEISPENWAMALRAVEDSIRRHGTGPGSRSYLNFIRLYVRVPARQG